VTSMFPETEPEKSTVTMLVPCPETMLAPAGNCQRYWEALGTGAMLNTFPALPGQGVGMGVITATGGFGACVHPQRSACHPVLKYISIQSVVVLKMASP